jgi:retron-type reverse transcriptase
VATLETPNKIRDLQRALYMRAKKEPKFRFYALYDKVYRVDVLEHAYRLARANGGAPGPDGVTFEQIEQIGPTGMLEELHDALKTKTYRPGPVRRVYIPKLSGGERPLGIPNIRDRVVQTAAKLVLEPIFEADFDPDSYGFRPKRDAHQALDAIQEALDQGMYWIIDADLASYFDTIPHDRLMKAVAERVVDGAMLALVKMFLEAPIVDERDGGGPRRNSRGTPQGGVVSPLLANIYLNLLDRNFRRREALDPMQARLVRYADDRAPRRRGKETGRSNGRSFAAREMRAGPSGSGYRTGAQTTGCCSGPMAGVVSETEKAGPTRQVCAVKTNASEPLLTCRKRRDVHRNRAPVVGSGQARGKPVDCSRGDRHEDGVSTAQALVWNVGTFCLDVKRALQAVDP